MTSGCLERALKWELGRFIWDCHCDNISTISLGRCGAICCPRRPQSLCDLFLGDRMTNPTKATPDKANVTPKPVIDLTDEQELVNEAQDASRFAASLSGGGDLPPLQRAIDAVNAVPDAKQRRQRFTLVQRLYGNGYAADVARQVDGEVVQRHPPGAPLLGGTATAGGGADPDAGDQPLPEPAGGTAIAEGGEGGGTAAPAAGGAAAAAPGTASGGSTPAAPRELSMPTLQTTFARNAIQTTFGRAAGGRTFVTGNITIVADNAALCAQYDRIQIANGVVNRDTGVAWATGDKARWNQRRGFRTNAFAYNGNIWIDATQTDPTATVHEMLHVNTANSFLSTVGRVINEGTTQRFALRVVRNSGHSVAGSEHTYVQEQGIVNRLVDIISEGILENAYFNNPQALVNTYESLMGASSFAVLKRTLNDTPAGYTAAGRILRPPSAQTRIALINTLLDWWVSDTDLDHVERIYMSANTSDRAAIRVAIEPRLTSLTSLGQRFRLRAVFTHR